MKKMILAVSLRGSFSLIDFISAVHISDLSLIYPLSIYNLRLVCWNNIPVHLHDVDNNGLQLTIKIGSPNIEGKELNRAYRMGNL